MKQPPVIYLLSADGEAVALPQLRAEQQAIVDVFRDLTRQGQVEVVPRPAADAAQIFKDLPTYKGRISIIHFAGHATPEGLLMDRDTLAQAKGLARAFATEPNLLLVFLNGCSTADQAALMQEAKIPVIIATPDKIRDDRAAEFALTFYRALAVGDSIAGAFELAVGWLEQRSDHAGPSPVMRNYRHFGQETTKVNSEWGLWHLSEADAEVRPFAEESQRRWWWLLLIPVLAVVLWWGWPRPPEKVESPPHIHFIGFVMSESDSSLLDSVLLRLDRLPTDSVWTMDGSFRFDSVPGKAGDGVRMYVCRDGDTVWNEWLELPGPEEVYVADSLLYKK